MDATKSNYRKCPDCNGGPLKSVPKTLPAAIRREDEPVKVEDWDFQCESCGKIWKFEALRSIERIQNVWQQFGYEWPALQK